MKLPHREDEKPSGRRDHLVTLIGKPDCHLCEEAQRVVERVCTELAVAWEQKDITQDPELHQAYWEQVPVVLVDGLQHTFWKVEENRLRRRLTRSAA
ncbi:glutaredoxin family protein [Streptomyces flaveolus]|uniref:Glutaredoxin family protein n=1 Tax=Streptomyces flaveolus TaxID=67297 RepID=A0ABV1VJC3_9ACTN